MRIHELTEDFAGDIEAEFGVILNLYGNAEQGYTLSRIEVPKPLRGSGIGSKIMQRIVDMADAQGAIIALTPDTAFGGSKGRLIQFYKQFGFVPNRGRNKDFSFRETMIRTPEKA